MRRTMSLLRPWFYAGPALLLVGALVAFPIIYTVILSMTNLGVFNWKTPSFVGLRNYWRALGALDSEFLQAAWQTVVWTAVNLSLQFCLSLGVALLLNTPGLKGAGVYKTLFLLPWAVPSYISALIWRNGIFNTEYGLLNRALVFSGFTPVEWLSRDLPAFLAILAVNLWLALPFLTLVVLGGLQGIPRDYYDSACIDGAGAFRQLRSITIPLLEPVLKPAMIMTAFVTFKQFDLVYLMIRQTGSRTGAGFNTVIVYAYERAFVTNNYGLSASLSVIVFAFMVGLTFLASRTGKSAGKDIVS